MIGLDTSVLVRYLAQDDARQAALATRLIEKELSAAELLAAVEDLLNTPQFHLERRELVAATVRTLKAGKGAKAGFVDALIAQLAAAEGCSHTASFDKAAVRSAGMVLLK